MVSPSSRVDRESMGSNPYPLVSPAQQAVDTLVPEAITNFRHVWKVFLQMLNLSPEAYWWWFREVAFGPDYHPRLTVQKMQAVGFRYKLLLR